MRTNASDKGFTLIELLVVILIIAILAAIAVPIFIRQRDKALVSQVTAALKDAATAIETYGTETLGNFAGVNGATSNPANAAYGILTGRGYRKNVDVSIVVATSDSDSQYCITATHAGLDSHPWEVATYNSSDGSPRPNDVDACP